MAKMCESCGMPLKKESVRGIRADGSVSQRYCMYCYNEGAFTDPSATAESLRKTSIEAMTRNGWPRILAVFLTKNISRLPRWQQEDTSQPNEE